MTFDRTCFIMKMETIYRKKDERELKLVGNLSLVLVSELDKPKIGLVNAFLQLVLFRS